MNPVGFDAAVRIEGHEHPNFGGNVNEVLHGTGAPGLVLKAVSGDEPAIGCKVSITTLANLKALVAPPHDSPEGLRVSARTAAEVRALKLDDPAHTVIWMEDALADLSPAWLAQGAPPSRPAPRSCSRAEPCRC